LLAAAVPNTVASSFAGYENRTSDSETRNQVRVLREQVSQYELELHAAEERLRSYRERANIIEPKTQAAEEIRRLSTMQGEVDAQIVSRDALSRLLSQLEASDGGDEAAESYRRLAAFPPFVTNTGVQNILQSLITLEDKRSEAAVLRTAQSPDVKAFDERVSALDAQLHQFAASYLRGLETQIDIANSQLAASHADLSTLPAREVEFVRLTREAELLNQVYTYLQTQLKQAEIREATELGKVHVVDVARLPHRPVSPRPMINVILATVMGLMLGGAVAMGKRLADPRVRAASDAEAASGVPVLEVIPGARRNRTGRRSRSSQSWAGAAEMGVKATDAYQSLWFSLVSGTHERLPSVLVVSSTLGDDGKSLTAAGLAATLAAQGLRTLLVDADLRHGTLHDLLDAPNRLGLLQLLRGEAPLEEVIRGATGPGGVEIQFLSSGGTTPNPVELLSSPAMDQLLQELRDRFEVIILDTPPLNQVRDGIVLRALADDMILVAQAGSTHKHELSAAAQRLRHLNLPARGLVLNEPTGDRRRSFDWIYPRRIRVNGDRPVSY
jgi:tyrosine-protein kinase Etk/Wzc